MNQAKNIQVFLSDECLIFRVEVDRGEGRGAVKLYVHCLIHKFISIASFKEGVKEYFYFMFFNRPQLFNNK